MSREGLPEQISANELRESVQVAYSGTGADYDLVRSDESGSLLGEYDIDIAQSMVPFDTALDANNLEVGSGTGRFTIPFLNQGYSFTASDINDSLLQSLREKLLTEEELERRCTVKVENGFALTFKEDSVDGILSIHVVPRFETRADQAALLSEFDRVIKPGGKILFNFSNRNSLLYGKRYRGHLISYSDVFGKLQELGLNVIDVRGKWLVNGSLLRKLPSFLRRPAIFIDRMLLKFWCSRAWDVFILVEKVR